MSKKQETTKSVQSVESTNNVKWYFISPSGTQLHSREYPADRKPLGAIWVSMNNAGELCYRTSTVKSLFNSDLKAVSATDGYTLTRKDGSKATYRLLGTTAPLSATDPAVVAFIAAHQTAQPTSESTPEPKAVEKSAKSNNAKKAENKKSGKARK